jgi:hypothetical protein
VEEGQVIPAKDIDDPCRDPEAERASEWWEAELEAVIASGFPAETAARMMVIVGAVKLAQLEGRRDAGEWIRGFGAQIASADKSE